MQTSLTATTTKPNNGHEPKTLKQWVEPSLINSFQNFNLSNPSNPTFFVSDTDKQGEFVTREHWQRETGNDMCNIPSCNKIVGKAGAGKQHCRK